LWHTSRYQPIAVIGGRCRSRADNLQPATVEAGRVTPMKESCRIKLTVDPKYDLDFDLNPVQWQRYTRARQVK